MLGGGKTTRTSHSGGGGGPAVHEKGIGNARSNVDHEEMMRIAAGLDYSEMVFELRENIRVKQLTATPEARIHVLLQLRKAFDERFDDILSALEKDLGRHHMEGFHDVACTVAEIDEAVSNLKTWMEPVPVKTPITMQPGYSYHVAQPKGVVLVVAPWNFPIYLAFSGLVASICAGNATVLKPSEITPNCAKIVQEIADNYLDRRLVRIVQGAIPETTALLRERWDHILYTGNGAVGRIIYNAASKYLTPVTLELGGKSPVYVDKSAALSVTSARLMGSKLLNNGQVCVSPDYVLVHESVASELISQIKLRLQEFFGANPQKSDSLARIVNTHHFDRIKRLLEEPHGGEVVIGGLHACDRNDKFIPPTVVVNPSPTSLLMQEEIFGPLLPIITVRDENEAIQFINARENPLALYIFAEDQGTISKVLDSTLSGGVGINDCIFQVANPSLPFGGVGTSGIGNYHGKFGFDELSHIRGVLSKSTWIDAKQRYYPYDKNMIPTLKRIVVGPLVPQHVKNAMMAGGAAVAGITILRSFM